MGVKIQHIMVFLLCVLQSALFAQMDGVEKIDGKTFKVYNVKEGNTLFSLSNEMGVPVDTIIHYNPIAASGLKIGQRLLIPIIDKELSSEEQQEEPRFKQYKHVVKKQETLYGISRKYDCSIDEIVAANPGIENGLQIGQYLIIPCFQAEEVYDEKIEEDLTDAQSSEEAGDEEELHFEPIFIVQDSVLRYTVQPGETLYSISRRYMVSIKELKKLNNLSSNDIAVGSTLVIPVKSENDFSIERKTVPNDSSYLEISTKETYNIVLLLPIKTNSNPRIFSNLLEPETQLDNVTGFAIDFLMGAQMALDSLERLGLNAEVHVLDTEGTTDKMNKILNSPPMQQADLVIGPFFSQNIELVAQWAQNNHKHVVVPVSAPASIIEGNPYVSLAVPSDLTLLGGLAKYIAHKHWDDQVFLIKAVTQEEKDRNKYFKRVLEMYGNQMGRQIPIKEVGRSASGREFANLFDLDTHNVFISFSDNAQGVMKFINNINNAKNQSPKHGRAKVTVFGLRNWHNIDPLNSYYKNRFELHTAMPSHINYNDLRIENMVFNYREKYKADASQFSLQGFDVVFFFVDKMLLGIESRAGLINQFQMDNLGANYGKENTTTFIVKQSDYELHLMGIENYSLSQKVFPNKDEERDSDKSLNESGSQNED